MGDDEEMEEMSEQSLEMSEWLRFKCMGLWDIHNTRQLELQVLARNALFGERLTVQRDRARTWDRQGIIDYHMGTTYASTNAAIKWALINNSKIKALKYYLIEIGDSMEPEDIKFELDCSRNILNAEGQDGVKWAFIQNFYNYWDKLSDRELYEI